MSENKKWQLELSEYIRQEEPEKKEKSEAWQTAIGLQAVDGLRTSEYLLETAKDHIEGKIDIDAVQKRIQSYYEERKDRQEAEADAREADIVSARITALLGERTFHFSPAEWQEIINHIAKFTSDIWQIHPFGEGNTRATAVFIIKYLKALGFQVSNDAFSKYSWYFRNALVRANYNNLQNGVATTTKYMELFFENLFMDRGHELKLVNYIWIMYCNQML